MITLNPYLVFKDNCEDAFNFYKLVFGGDFLFMGRYKDVPQTERQSFPLEADEKIMHISLPIDTRTILMGCDSIAAYEQPTGNNFYLYIMTGSQEEANRLFNELSAQGKIKMAMNQTFWSTYFGMLTDKFGINWMITFDPNKK